MLSDSVTCILLLDKPLVLISSLALGLLLDILYPRHKGFLLKIHPVHTCYLYSKKLYKPYASKIWGFINSITCLLIHITPPGLLLFVINYLPSPFDTVILIIVTAVIVKFSMGITLLFTTAKNVGYNILRQDESAARESAQGLVRRNVMILDIPHVLSATIESLSESLVDGYTSPLTYYLLLGPLGALFQRMVNTLDGSLGFKTPELAEQGWFPAKLDTLLNFIPARITGILILLLSKRIRTRLGLVLNLLKNTASRLDSINAGWPIGAMALGLGVMLEKPGSYKVGSGDLPTLRDLDKASRIGFHAVLTYTLLIVFLYILILKVLISI